MNHELDHEALVQAWLKEPVWMPESDLPRLAEIVHELPQRQGWLPPAVNGRIPSMLNATRFVAAGFVVALFGGFLGFKGGYEVGKLRFGEGETGLRVFDHETGERVKAIADVTEGATWDAAPEGNPEGTSRRRLDSGWFASDRRGYWPDGGDDIWVHVDGEWISLVPLGLEPVREGCGADISAVGDLTFISADEECLADRGGARWILKLDATDEP